MLNIQTETWIVMQKLLSQNNLPRIGKTSTRPSILYRPVIEIFGTTAYTSNLDVSGSAPNPLKLSREWYIKLINMQRKIKPNN